MAKLKLNPESTFRAKVEIPVPGGTAEVECVFKYRSKADLIKWVGSAKGATDPDVLLGCLVGWDLDDEFNDENIKLLCDSYPAAARVITRKYADELSGIRQGN